MIWFGLAGGILLIVLLARLFGRAAGAADRPAFVMEKPPLPGKLSSVADVVDRWREEGRLTREEHEHLSALLREDAAAFLPRP